MSGVSTTQKNKLTRELIDVTRATDADARRILKAHKWQLAQAIDAFYDDDLAMANAEARDKKAAGPDKSQANLTAMFDHYAGKDGQQMDFDATQAYCQDLNVALDDVVVLAVAELTKAPTMGYFDRKAWIDGWKEVKKDSIATQKEYIKTLRSKLSSEEAYFTKVYGFCFDYAKESGQKSLSLEIAASLWPLLFAAAPESMFSDDAAFSPENSEQQTNYLGAFFDFLRTEKAGRSISKDVWTLFLEFAQSIDPKFESYDIDAAWPSTIDEFVDWAKAKLANGEEIKGQDAMEE